MIEFKVSAPGRLSLFGEHAVLRYKAGLTAGINLRTSLTFKEVFLPSQNTIQINFPQTRLYLRMPVETFLNFHKDCVKNMASLREQVLHLCDREFELASHKKIVQTFFYLLCLITHKENIQIRSFTIHLSTELMMDNELACPASFTVCLAACLMHWSRLQKDTCKPFDNAFLELIRTYAARCKEISFEFGNWVDVTACTYGSIIKYLKDTTSETMSLTSLRDIPNITILLVDSNQTQNLEAQVQKVKELNDMLPEVVYSIIQSINLITCKADTVFRNLVDVYKNNELNHEMKRYNIVQLYNILKNCIRTNQNLLHALNVSHDHLDNICIIAQQHGMYGKYTDIGNGRYAYIWCPHHSGELCMHMKHFSNEMKRFNFVVRQTNFAVSGVQLSQ